MTNSTSLTDAERARLEQRRDRLMKLMKEGDGSGMDPDDREDLAREWSRIDTLLQSR